MKKFNNFFEKCKEDFNKGSIDTSGFLEQYSALLTTMGVFAALSVFFIGFYFDQKSILDSNPMLARLIRLINPIILVIVIFLLLITYNVSNRYTKECNVNNFTFRIFFLLIFMFLFSLVLFSFLIFFISIVIIIVTISFPIFASVCFYYSRKTKGIKSLIYNIIGSLIMILFFIILFSLPK